MKKLDVYQTEISIITFKELLNRIIEYNLQKSIYICFTDILVS